MLFRSDAEFKKWLPWIRGGFTRDRAKEFAREFSASNWASGEPVWALRVGGELMGVIDLRDRSAGAWEIGFWMHPEARGKGLMTSACALVVQAAFEHLDATRILHFARVGNDRSLRIARNLGFRPEGVRRKATPLGVERQWQSALLKSDWTARANLPLVRPFDAEVIDGARPTELVAQAARLGAGPSAGPRTSAGVPRGARPSAGAPSTTPDPAPPTPGGTVLDTGATPRNTGATPRGTDSAPLDQAAIAMLMADTVYETYRLAGEMGVDLDAALARRVLPDLQQTRR